eukprot:657696-Amphidinium_carterae.2
MHFGAQEAITFDTRLCVGGPTPQGRAPACAFTTSGKVPSVRREVQSSAYQLPFVVGEWPVWAVDNSIVIRLSSQQSSDSTNRRVS